MHPADEIRGSTSLKLAHKKIVVGVTGSIAAVETIALVRELLRHGADVIAVMTPAATRILHPDALEFATGNKPIIELTGKTEHVAWCGLTKNHADLLLISPCTANTLSKIVYGIDDTPVTTFATTAYGAGIPIIVVPAMHLSMYQHTGLQENIKRGKKRGIIFLEPDIKKNKAKMPKTDTIVSTVIRTIGKKDFQGKKILIIGGGTAEPLDDVRVITNKSSGKTAVCIAQEAFERGATIDLWYGHATEPVPPFIHTTQYQTINDLKALIKKTKLHSYDAIIVCAAIADYTVTKVRGKIPSGQKNIAIQLTPTQKILDILRIKAPHAKIIGFKLESDKKTLKKKAQQLLHEHHLDGVIANTTDALNTTTSEIEILKKNGESCIQKGKKEELASHILDSIL